MAASITRKSRRIRDVGYGALMVYALLVPLPFLLIALQSEGQLPSSVFPAVLVLPCLAQVLFFLIGAGCALLAWPHGERRLALLVALYPFAYLVSPILSVALRGVLVPLGLATYGSTLWQLPVISLSILFALQWFFSTRGAVVAPGDSANGVPALVEGQERVTVAGPGTRASGQSSELIIRWIIATTLGFFLGALLAGVAEAFVFDDRMVAATPSNPRGAGDETIPLGLVSGAALAVVSQAWIALRSRRLAVPWIMVSAPGMLLGPLAAWLLLLQPRDPFRSTSMTSIFLLVLMVTLLLSVPQWLLLRRRAPLAWLWMAALALAVILGLPLGWLSGLMVGFPLGMVVSALTDGHIGGIAGAATVVAAVGVVQGFVGGFTLAWLLSLRLAEEAV